MKNKRTQQNFPEGWQEITLASIGNFLKGSGITKEQLSESGHNAIRYGELYTKHHFRIKKIYSFIPDDVAALSTKITCGDILFAGSGETIDEIGKSAAYILNEDAYAGGDIIIFRPKNADSLFLAYFLNVGEARKKLRELGQGQSVVHIYKSDIENIKLRLPSISEQKRIVAVLETWDRAIEKLTRKIEIKKEVKKGLMQELLAGKTRLNGCTSSWSNHELEQLLKPASEKYNPLTNQKSRKCIELEHLQKNDPELLGYVNSNNQKSIKSVFCKGDVLFGKLRPYLKKYLLAEFDGVCSTEIWVLKTTQKTHSLYMYYLIQTARFVSIANVSSGTHMPRADWDYMKNISFSVPDDLEEQKAIANILSTSDTEIRILVKKLNFLKDQKKYLLNNLITGTIRTPESLSVPN